MEARIQEPVSGSRWSVSQSGAFIRSGDALRGAEGTGVPLRGGLHSGRCFSTCYLLPDRG